MWLIRKKEYKLLKKKINNTVQKYDLDILEPAGKEIILFSVLFPENLMVLE